MNRFFLTNTVLSFIIIEDGETGCSHIMSFDFTHIINAIPSPVLVAEPVKNDKGITEDFRIIFQNDAFSKAANYALRESLRFSVFRANINQDVPWFDMALRTSGTGIKQEATYYSPANKSWFHACMERSDADLVVVTLTDITKEKRHSQELHEAAFRDTLTSLPNRNCVQDAVEIAIDTARYTNTKFALLLIDLDNLKNINDVNGQAAGDDMIRRTSDALRACACSSSDLYSMGGDEFLIILKNACTSEKCSDDAECVYNSLVSSNISASGSLVIFPDDSENGSELLRFSDMAMHEAKRQGKGRIVRFNNEMQKSFTRKMKLESKLAEAVLSGEFQQYYQPQFDIKTGKLRGFEALIRWNDSENGNIPPSEFIPIAEECGLIIPIGKWVLRTAFTELKRWQTEYGFTGVMSVNVSPLQMKQENFVSELADMISSFDIDPDTIEIEITEGVMIDNMHVAVETLAFLKQMGLRVSLDDFGTGYSSLSYLQMLPLDTLKIDKSFINNITDSSGIQANITNSIISMVSKMGLSTIAEGVEAPEQLELLAHLNCSIVQGFLRGKPMPACRCEAYLSGDESALETNEEVASASGSRYSTYRTQPV